MKCRRRSMRWWRAAWSSPGAPVTGRRVTGSTSPIGARSNHSPDRVPHRADAMANLRAINSLIQSLADWLKNSYDLARKPADQGGGGHDFLPEDFHFTPVSSSSLSREDFAGDDSAGAQQVSVYLYRVSLD